MDFLKAEQFHLELIHLVLLSFGQKKSIKFFFDLANSPQVDLETERKGQVLEVKLYLFDHYEPERTRK